MARPYIFGSISHGTHRPEDLLPTFASVLEYLSEGEEEALLDICGGLITQMNEAGGFDELDDGTKDYISEVLNELLFQALNDYAAPYHYFGAHEGDGSDFGFWFMYDAYEEAVRDGEIRVVDDLAKAEEEYEGEEYIAVVNDHGNVTLYAPTTGFKEIWSVV